MKIRKIFARLIATPIINRKARHKVRDFIENVSIKDLFALKKYKKTLVTKNTVLLLETNDCHAECLPGFAKYLLDLGYNVDVLTLSSLAQEKAFSNFQHDRLELYSFPRILFDFIIKSKKIKDYYKILLSSSYSYFHKSPVIHAFPNIIGDNLIIVSHDLNDLKTEFEQSELNNNKIIMLGNIGNAKMVNAHYFGDFKTHKKNSKTVFVTVGGIEPSRKNHKILIDAIETISKKTNNFKITIIGNGNIETIPQNIRKFIDIKGRLNFPDMYNEMEIADFFLPLLDPENPAHDRYITSGVTGSAQLIYGFKKIPVINEKFVNFYNFNNTNSVIYESNSDLSTAMISAINMTDAEYNKKLNELKSVAMDIYKESINNLKYLLRQTKEYKIISLGNDCLPRKFLTTAGLKPSKQMGEMSMPFDLCVTPIESLTHFLKTDFADYFDGLEYSDKDSYWINKKFNMIYNHDTDCGKDEKEKFISRFQTRIENFKKIISGDDFLFFVMHFVGNEKYLEKLYLELKKLRNGDNFELLVLNTDNKIKKKYKHHNLKILNESHPFEQHYLWWTVQNTTSESGINFKNNITQFVSNEIERKFKLKKYER